MTIQRIIPVSRRNDVTFHSDGRIDLTAHVAKALAIAPGDVINIACTGERHGELYLYVSRRASQATGRHAGTCRPAKSGHYLRAFSKQLTTHMQRLCHVSGTLRLRVGAAEEVSGLGTALPIIVQGYTTPAIFI